MKRHTIEDFWKLISITPDCWEWTGRLNNKGYGDFRMRGQFETRLTHRIMFELAFRKPPDNMDVCHKCDNPKCLNPEHLFLGTRKENMQDSVNKGRSRRLKFTEHQLQTMKAMYDNGQGCKAIGKAFGVDSCVITRICGSRTNPQKKVFTDEQMADIIKRHQSNETHVAIGAVYGISDAQVIRLLQKHKAFVPYGRSRWRKAI